MKTLRRSLPLILMCSIAFSVWGQNMHTHFTALEIENANTAAQEDYLTKTEKEVFVWLNLARA